MKQRTGEELLELRKKHVPAGPANLTPIFARRAEGAVVEDVDGRAYIDFAGGIGVMNVGHSCPAVVSAIKEQADRMSHTCFHVAMYESYIDLAMKLNEITPGDFEKKTMFANSGAEAVENSIKIARYATKRQAVIAFQNAFHGRTYMAMTLTAQVHPYKWGFGPFCPEVYRAPFAYCYRCPLGLEYPSCGVHCADYMEEFFLGNISADSVAAIIAEPVQGEGGFIVPPPEYFPKLRKICNAHGILLIIDEIQSGMGRSGQMYASESLGAVPDMILTGKSLGGGLPLTAVTGKAEVMDAPHVGGLGGTFGGNPIACNAGLAVIDELEGGLIEKAKNLGAKVHERFGELKKRHDIIGDTRGLGPMAALELVKDRRSKAPATEEAGKLVRIAYEKGLIVLRCGPHHNVVRVLMPLVITDDQLDKGFEILEECFREVQG
jgi:4-aminobutyrate aminotransferase / (S)-3-amino-2-methylpropionate transaminase / 5-aminovalerate transaminase